MAQKYNYSFDSMKRMRDSPVSELAEKLVLKKREQILTPSMSAVNKEVTSAITSAFEYLKEKKTSQPGTTPTDNIVKSWIREAETRMSASLKTHSAQHLERGAKNILTQYGTQYLSNQNLDLSLNNNMVADITGTNGVKYGMKGTANLTFYDAEAKAMQIVNLRNEMSVRDIEMFDSASRNLQIKSDAFLAMQTAIKEGKMVEKLTVSYADNKIYGDVRWTPNVSFSDKQILGELQTDLSIEVAKAAGYEQMVYDKLKDKVPVLDAYKDAFSQIMRTQGCNPGVACKSCMMRYSCHIRFAQDIGDKLQSLKGLGTTAENEKISLLQRLEQRAKDPAWPSPEDDISQLKMFENAQKEDWKKRNQKIKDYDSYINNTVNDYYQQRREFYLQSGNSSDHSTVLASQDSTTLRKSMEVARRYKRGLFEDSVLNKDIISEGRLGVSVLDVMKKTPHVWLSENILRTVKAISYDSVDSVLKNLDINRPEMTERIIDNMFKDEKFVRGFNQKLSDNAASEMYRRGLLPTVGNAMDVLSNTTKMLDNDLTVHLMDNLNKATIDEVIRVDASSLERKISSRVEYTKANYDAIFDAAKSKGIINDDPAAFRKKVAEMDHGFAKKEKFSLSVPRNTLSTIGKALILAQLAGNETILNMIDNKFQKVASFLGSQEQGIDTGEHNSTYGTMRRLLLSDFGSSTRKYGMVSEIYSYIAAKGSAMLSKVKNQAADFALRSKSSSINPAFMEVPNEGLIYGGVAAGVALTMYSIVPRSRTRDEDRIHAKAKNRSLKETRKPQATSDSRYQNPQSDLRERYKVHGQFGSPFLGKVGLILEEIAAEPYIEKLVDGTISLTKQLYSHSAEWVAKLKLGSKVADEVVDIAKSKKILSDAGKSVGTEIESAEQHIREVKRSAVSRFRSKEMWKSGKETIGNLTDKVDIKRLAVDNTMSAGMSAITSGSKAGHAVITKHIEPRHEVIVTSTRGNREQAYIYDSTGVNLREQPYIEAMAGRNITKYNGSSMVPKGISGKIMTESPISKLIAGAYSGKTNPMIFTMEQTQRNKVVIDDSVNFRRSNRMKYENNGVDVVIGDKMSTDRLIDINKDMMFYTNPGASYGKTFFDGDVVKMRGFN